MNTAVENKVAELVKLGTDYGFKAELVNIEGSYVIVKFNLVLRCKVITTEAGNASVVTIEGKHKVLNSSLESKLSYYKSIVDRRLGKVA